MIQKLSRETKNSPQYEDRLFDKINEIIDAINKRGSAYVGEQPSIYDLNAMGKLLKRKK